MQTLPASSVSFKAISDIVGNSLALHVLAVDNGATIHARRKVTYSRGLVKTAYLHVVIQHANGRSERWREQKDGNFRTV